MRWRTKEIKLIGSFPFIAITSIPMQPDLFRTGKQLYLRQMLKKQQMIYGAESRKRAKARSGLRQSSNGRT